MAACSSSTGRAEWARGDGRPQTASRLCGISSAERSGGPIRRDKMFFFGSADMFRHTSNLVLNARYPTAAERSGNLSSLLGHAAGTPAPIRIIDPLTGQPFAGNIIPAESHQSGGVELFKLIPDAPQPARLTDFNAVYIKPQFDNSEKYDGRFDYNSRERTASLRERRSLTSIRRRDTAAMFRARTGRAPRTSGIRPSRRI